MQVVREPELYGVGQPREEVVVTHLDESQVTKILFPQAQPHESEPSTATPSSNKAIDDMSMTQEEPISCASEPTLSPASPLSTTMLPPLTMDHESHEEESSASSAEEDFYDAQEEAQAQESTNGSNRESRLSESTTEENKYIVRNQDTGETYDIRELETHPVDCYNIFPSNFASSCGPPPSPSAPVTEIEIDVTENGNTSSTNLTGNGNGANKSKSTLGKSSSSRQKLKMAFSRKHKVKDPSKQNFVQVLASKKKDRREFDELFVTQRLAKHQGTIWTMKFSHDGARLASGGQDAVLRVWRVEFPTGDEELQAEKEKQEQQNPSCSCSQSQGAPDPAQMPTKDSTDTASPKRDCQGVAGEAGSPVSTEPAEKCILTPDPEKCFHGHTMPIVDVSWSRSNFILSASMDKTVRLWHISREECLHVFQHPDSVPAVDFHPKEDRYFFSGCFDNKARIWDIPDGCVVSYVQTPVMITAACFNPSGTRAIVGLLNGQCIFYQVNAHQQMNYYTQIECRNSRGRKKSGRKVTGIEFDPEGKYFMVSTNDSRMRLFSVDNYSRICKYKGVLNDHLQIKGRFSQDGEFIICGSENGHVYVWNRAIYASSSRSIIKSSKQDRNSSYEYFCAEPPGGIVTVALFAPASTFAMVHSKLLAASASDCNPCTGLLATASYNGCIRFFEKTVKG